MQQEIKTEQFSRIDDVVERMNIMFYGVARMDIILDAAISASQAIDRISKETEQKLKRLSCNK